MSAGGARRGAAAAAVYVVGSINTDLVAYVQRLPVGGETMFGERFAQFAGGKGANQAVAAARAGATTTFIGAVGDDAYGRAGRASLEQAGVIADRLVTLPGQASGVALILVDGRGENQIVVAPGANRQFGPELAPPPAGSAPAAPVLLLQNEIDPATTAACAARWGAAGARVIWNLAPAPETPPPAEVLAAVEFLLVNEVELAALAGAEAPATSTAAATGTGPVAATAPIAVTDPAAAAIAGSAAVAERARALVADGRAAPVRNLIVTLGADGCLWVRRGGAGQVELLHQPARPATAVDTVGAGDCFCGVFAAALAAGAAIPAALRYASAGAALSVQQEGAQPSMPHRARIEALLAGGAAPETTA